MTGRYLLLGYGEITKRDRDGEPAGCIAFQPAGQGEIPFNYENTAEVTGRNAITITVKAGRLGKHLKQPAIMKDAS
jgi:hypothetical protein